MPSSTTGDATVAVTATGVHDPGGLRIWSGLESRVLTLIVHLFEAPRKGRTHLQGRSKKSHLTEIVKILPT